MRLGGGCYRVQALKKRKQRATRCREAMHVAEAVDAGAGHQPRNSRIRAPWAPLLCSSAEVGNWAVSRRRPATGYKGWDLMLPQPRQMMTHAPCWRVKSGGEVPLPARLSLAFRSLSQPPLCRKYRMLSRLHLSILAVPNRGGTRQPALPHTGYDQFTPMTRIHRSFPEPWLQ